MYIQFLQTHDELKTHSLDLQKTFIVAEGRVSSDVFLTKKKSQDSFELNKYFCVFLHQN